jgi:hypothetical protein
MECHIKFADALKKKKAKRKKERTVGRQMLAFHHFSCRLHVYAAYHISFSFDETFFSMMLVQVFKLYFSRICGLNRKHCQN